MGGFFFLVLHSESGGVMGMRTSRLFVSMHVVITQI